MPNSSVLLFRIGLSLGETRRGEISFSVDREDGIGSYGLLSLNIEDFYSGGISECEWVVGQTPNVKPEYFAYSNYRCSKKLKKYVRKNAEDASLLFDYRHWATDEPGVVQSSHT